MSRRRPWYRNVTILAGNGTPGLPGDAPFDAILVAAAAKRMPVALKRQLAIGAKLGVPVGDEALQSLLCVTRTGERTWREDDLGEVRFVPLIGGGVRRGPAG